jgi:hypothetical protein
MLVTSRLSLSKTPSIPCPGLLFTQKCQKRREKWGEPQHRETVLVAWPAEKATEVWKTFGYFRKDFMISRICFVCRTS